MVEKTSNARSRAWKVAASLMALSFGLGLSSKAHAQSAADFNLTPQPVHDIVTNDTVIPGPAGANPGSNFSSSPQVLDSGINGIGQMIAFEQSGPGASLGLCTGTLINPRTVITAAHCVYDAPAGFYGSQTGVGGGVNGNFGSGGALLTSNGIPISFGFSSTNRCQGVTVNGCAVGTGPYEQWRDANFHTNTGAAIYNGNQVWYGTGSQPVALGGGGEFGNEDIALVTLDTHASNIPTWTLLFSPLTGPTHSTITGYGLNGVGSDNLGATGIDYRRRSAENMIDALMSNNDWVDSPAIDPGNTTFANEIHALYWNDFDDPHFDPTRPGFFDDLFVNNFDFNGLGGTALPLEGSTAGGDSGGPLIVDQAFDRKVVAGVLTGSWSFNGGTSTYGQFNVYPPLFMYWEEIVQNNPYVYAAAKAGNADWTDPKHWVQLMDPNYAVIGRNGQLVNDVPNTHQVGPDGPVDKFGTLCFLGDACTTFDGPGNPVGRGPGLVIPGGPGSTNFVPNNVDPLNNVDPALTRKARYYDVTLSAPGETRLRSAVTIDRFTEDGLLTSLNVQSAGTLNVLSDFNHLRGGINVDGRINAGETLLLHGLLQGNGTFNPTFLTSVGGIIAPGTVGGVGTLTIQGDVVLASASDLLIDINRNGADLLRVKADAAQGTTGVADLGGTVWFNKASGPDPRAGQSFVFVSADGSVTHTFDDVNAFLGNLRPTVTYGPNFARVTLTAGRFSDNFLHAPELFPIAFALDQLRDAHYADMPGLYGQLDLMDPSRMAAAFSSLVPAGMLDVRGLLAMQDSGFASTLENRLGLLSRSDGMSGLSIMGSPTDVLSFGGNEGFGVKSDITSELSLASMMTGETARLNLPGGMTGFLSGGYDDTRASAEAGRSITSTNDNMTTWHMSGGVEQRFGHFMLGVAASYSSGEANLATTSALSDNDVAQSAVYGLYRFDNGVYLAGMVGAGMTRTSTERAFAGGSFLDQLQGETRGDLFLASAEAGVNLRLADHFFLTPKVSLRQTTVHMQGFSETGGEAALAFDDQTSSRMEARIGASLNGVTHVRGWLVSPSIDASLVSNLSGNEDGITARFAAAPDQSFYLPGLGRDTMYGELSGGLQLMHDATSFGLRFESSVGRQELHEDRVVARFGYTF